MKWKKPRFRLHLGSLFNSDQKSGKNSPNAKKRRNESLSPTGTSPTRTSPTESSRQKGALGEDLSSTTGSPNKERRPASRSASPHRSPKSIISPKGSPKNDSDDKKDVNRKDLMRDKKSPTTTEPIKEPQREKKSLFISDPNSNKNKIPVDELPNVNLKSRYIIIRIT